MVILHPLLGEVEIWTNHVGTNVNHVDPRCMRPESIRQTRDKRTGLLKAGNLPIISAAGLPKGDT